LIIQTMISANRMFVLLASTSPVSTNVSKAACFNVSSENVTSLWHERFGHLNMKGLRTLAYKKMVQGLPILKNTSQVCTICMTGKQHRDPFRRNSTWRASKPLQLIHSDICGAINPESYSHKRYILTFIDDYSRKMWSYFLHAKSEAFDTFKRFKAFVENATGYSIICLRTDRGGEFTSSEFNDYCSTYGIARQLTAAYSPQQNGVAERRNRTLMNMVRCMLAARDVPKEYWPEAANLATHVLNRCPTSALSSMTPEEAWTARKPSVEHLKVFGCIGHVHVPDVTRKRLDEKSIKCVYMGVSEESKASRMYDPITKRIIISRDVVFDEMGNWDWKKSGETNSLDLVYEESEKNITFDTNTQPENDRTKEAIGDKRVDVHTRRRRPPIWMRDYESGDGLSDEEGVEQLTQEMQQLAMFISNDPTTFEEAARSQVWRDAMKSEMVAIEKNETWELIDLPIGAKKIGVKWLFKTKLNEKGEIDKCKARLVAKGYTQQAGIDYTEVFAPVARWDTIRLTLSIAANCGWKVYQLDVKSAFLHGEIEEEVYVEQTKGFEVKGAEDKVYKLKKALYGLKQAPRAWFSKIESYFVKKGFERSTSDHTLFTKKEGETDVLIVNLYVDDLIFTGSSEKMFEEFKRSMKREFEMTDLGYMRYFLGVEVTQTSSGIFICQKKYANEVLERFGLQNCSPVKNPIVPGCKLTKDVGGLKVDATIYKQMVGSLMYLTATRPDLMYVVSLVARFVEAPTIMHQQAVKGPALFKRNH